MPIIILKTVDGHEEKYQISEILRIMVKELLYKYPEAVNAVITEGDSDGM